MPITSYLVTDSRSDLGPLTTTFTPPADCISLEYIDTDVLGLNVAASRFCYTKSPLDGPNPDSTSVIASCYPDGYASFYNKYWDDYNTYSKLAFYSPASICPSGYTVACVQARSKGQSNPFGKEANRDGAETIWNLLRDGESATGCCPINYDCHPVYASLCSWQPVGYLQGTDGVKCPGTLTLTTTQTTAHTVLAMRVVVVQAATPEHIPTRTATSAPISSATTSSATTSSIPASSVPSENSLSKPSQGLPLAAKVAIGVVIPLVVILSGAACFFIYRYRRKRKLLEAAQGLGQDAPSNGGGDLETPKPELPGDDGIVSAGSNGTAFRKAELDATKVSSGGAVELPAGLAGGGLSELHGDSGLIELDSMSKGFSAVDVVSQDVNNQHVDERSKGLWQWSNYQD